jgi:molecular chaperone DnaJ
MPGGGFHDPMDIFREVFGGGGGDIFESFFGGSGRRQRRDGPQRGSDLRYGLEITLEEAAKGVEKELEFERLVACKTCSGTGSKSGGGTKQCRTCGGVGQVISSRGFFQIQQTCPECHGSGQTISDPCRDCRGVGRNKDKTRIRLKIPAGIEEGSRLRSSGNGDAGPKGGTAGDLYVVISIKDHDLFERDGHDLHCNVPLGYPVAALGGELAVPTLEGRVNVKVPAGTQNGAVFRLKAQGMKHLESDRKGDLYVHVQIAVPTKLTAEQREKLQEFSAALGDNHSPMHETFLERAKKFFF